jgi:DNA repair ATPase RecN
MGTLSSTRSRIQPDSEGSEMTEEHNDTTTVKVSMRDIYQEVQRQGKLLEQIASSLPTQESKVEDHENRIRKLSNACGRSLESLVSWPQSSAR